MAVDERSERNIETLRPEVRPLARKLVETAVDQGIHVKVIAGLRTFEEQEALYAQGRTKPGAIVTKARGGHSWHNFGLAFDIGIFSADGKEYYGESEDYLKCGRIGESLGLTWGGSWASFQDEPHFQYNPENYSLAELRQRTENGEDLFT
jgi:peptidoglycan L-alanyl-D-glutamate endopeptidase CwlK